MPFMQLSRPGAKLYLNFKKQHNHLLFLVGTCSKKSSHFLSWLKSCETSYPWDMGLKIWAVSIVWDTSITTQFLLTGILEVSVPIFCFLGCVCCRAMLHSAFDLFLSSWVASRDRKVI
jgi:hypothetical protein